ncbi:hypothetical protein CN931_16500 [Bacillus sp. AFS054943]|uniref:amidase domain-containing protein n=1 Tax=unclassified Bacillus (in: firmicutes) TaxID=185979 RepID=UPI000BFD9DA9|nr:MULTISPECIES: amidase domain-containing protein [unclassified Bacillus (in: firmicutes)]PGL81653.1 hypothetical protein CN931_16500 [Bacillus sp. AFS054943]PGX11311.1 hypothetical protein COE07_12625 [Bacillus sp. AFS033286]
MENKKVLLGLGVICALAMSPFDSAYAQEEIKKSETEQIQEKKKDFEDTTYDSYTLGEAETMLLDYFKRNNISYKLGTAELRKYLYDQLMYENDKQLKKEPHYKLLLAYAASYLNETDGDTLKATQQKQQPLTQSSNVQDKENDTNHIANKTIKQIKNENIEIEKQNSINKKLKEPQYAVPNEGGYNPATATSYAIRHARSTSNDKYGYYGGAGGDCTNFVSQVVEAGGKSIHRPVHVDPNTTNTWGTTDYWYNGIKITHPNGPTFRKVTTSWIRVSDFYKYWTKRIKYFDTYSDNSVWKGAQQGDVVQYKNSTTGQMWHTTYVSGKTPQGQPLVTQHSDPKVNEPIVLPSTSSYSVLKFTWS